MEKKTILVVDDEVKITEVLESLLESQGYAVVSAYNGADALSLFHKHPISLILLDLMLPDISGEEVCKEVRKISRVPIIMLTAKVEEEDQLRGLHIGADDYITKPFSLKTLSARISAVLRRSDDAPLSDTISFCDGDLEVDFQNYSASKAGSDAALTPNEFKLLSTFITYPTKVFTREELIESTFGIDFDGYDRTIDSHIKNIRGKIEDDSRKPRYILTVHGVGYKFGGESSGEKAKP